VTTVSETLAGSDPLRPAPPSRRIVGATLGAHILHEGFADLLYVGTTYVKMDICYSDWRAVGGSSSCAIESRE
jgi:hypothetical protein